MSPRSESAALRQFNTIHEKRPQIFKSLFKACVPYFHILDQKKLLKVMKNAYYFTEKTFSLSRYPKFSPLPLLKIMTSWYVLNKNLKYKVLNILGIKESLILKLGTLIIISGKCSWKNDAVNVHQILFEKRSTPYMHSRKSFANKTL